jgi:hypothetical protein
MASLFDFGAAMKSPGAAGSRGSLSLARRLWDRTVYLAADGDDGAVWAFDLHRGVMHACCGGGLESPHNVTVPELVRLISHSHPPLGYI